MAQTRKKAKRAAKNKATESEVPVRSSTGKAPAARTPSGILASFEDLDRLFDDFMRRRWPAPFQLQWPSLRGLSEFMEGRIPSVDIADRNSEIVVRAEVPGVDQTDLEVSIEDRTLMIKGKSREEYKDEKEDYYRQEIRSGQFSRSVLLPADVDAGKAKATYKDGVVELHLPKTGQSARRKINVT
jgi:HSP20 family protein